MRYAVPPRARRRGDRGRSRHVRLRPRPERAPARGRARARHDRALLRRPADVPAVQLGVVLPRGAADGDRAGAARAVLEEGAREHPDSASIQYGVARLEGRQGNHDAALAAALTALELVPAEQRDELRADMRDHAALAGIRDSL